MATFQFEIDASATYSTTAPTLEVLVDGVVVSSALIDEHTGSSLNYLRFELSFTGNYPGSLQFRFNDGAEGGRSIQIDSVRINGWAVDTTYITLLSLNQGQSSSINTSATDYLYGRVSPTLGDVPAETITGTTGDDNLHGSSQPEIINAGNGADRVRGLDDTDAIFGGIGNDTIFGGGGGDIIVGEDGDDNLYGEGGDDIIHGNAGIDIINGGAGNDLINGGSGADLLIGDLGDDILYGEDGADTLNGGAGNDTLYGDAGDDILSGGAGNDTIYGGLDNDTIYGAAGNDTLYGEAGNDEILAGAGNDFVYGNNGNDTLRGGAGNDTIEGNDGDDTVYGDDGDDLIEGGLGSNTLYGGNGTDTLTYASAAAAVSVSLAISSAQATGGAGTDTISEFENLTGSAYDDRLTGNSGANAIIGGDGDDIIDGGTGNDVLTGGNGTDTVLYIGSASAVSVNLSSGMASGGYGSDTLLAIENIIGSRYNDTLTGDNNANIIYGGVGSDTINGNGDSDTLYAVAPSVTIFSANFNSGSDSFSYADNVFGGTGGTYVNGTRITTDGVNGNGALEVVFDGTNATVEGNMSGGFNRTFSVADDVPDTTISFSYKVIRTGTYEVDEDFILYVEIDGIKHGLNGNDYIIQMESDGGDPTYDTGWRNVTIDLGMLTSGNHTVTIGGLVQGKDAANEDTTLRIDNIVIGSNTDSDKDYANTLDGGDGNDTLYGSAGADTLNGGNGDDIIYSASVASITSAQILAANPSVVYNATTNSFYQYVTTTLTWEAANSAATAATINGVAGHLAHSNSATENAYLDSISGASNIWIGGSDGAVNGEWRWVGGPDDGVQFWQGQAAGSAVGGAYTNWNGGEPNDYNGFEANIELQNGGRWNDQLPGTTRAYVIEWEASQILVSANTTTARGGIGNDTLYGGAGNDILYALDETVNTNAIGATAISGGGTPVTVLDEAFGSDNGGFSYSDGSDPANVTVSGTRITTDGNNANGSLEITITNNNGNFSNAYGFWSQTINFVQDLENVEISFYYRHNHASQNDNGEDSHVFYDLDGGSITNFISTGLGSGGALDTGWQLYTISLGSVSSGSSYDLRLGLWHDGSSGNNENAWARFDDVVISGETAGVAGPLTAGYSITDADVNSSNILYGGDGDDTLYGSSGNDTLNGGDGADTIYSGTVDTQTALIQSLLAANSGLAYNYETGGQPPF